MSSGVTRRFDSSQSFGISDTGEYDVFDTGTLYSCNVESCIRSCLNMARNALNMAAALTETCSDRTQGRT